MDRKQTITFKNKPYILSAYSLGGEKEGQGPLKDWFDDCLRDDTYDEPKWEKSESKMLDVEQNTFFSGNLLRSATLNIHSQRKNQVA